MVFYEKNKIESLHFEDKAIGKAYFEKTLVFQKKAKEFSISGTITGVQSGVDTFISIYDSVGIYLSDSVHITSNGDFSFENTYPAGTYTLMVWPNSSVPSSWTGDGITWESGSMATLTLTGNNANMSINLVTVMLFADITVKNILAGLYGKTLPGQVTYEEAAAVTQFPTTLVFQGTAITSFDEFRFFYNLQQINEGEFRDCRNLVSIKLPPLIEQGSGTVAYTDCISLTNIDLGQIWYLSSWTLDGCISLTKVIIPDTVVEIGQGAFYASGLTEITVPVNVYYIGDWTFGECPNLETVIMKPADPPQLAGLASSVFDISPTARIYVPDASVTAYRTATNWSGIASRIFSINTMP